MWRDMQEKKCEDEMPDVFTYQYRRGGGRYFCRRLYRLGKWNKWQSANYVFMSCCTVKPAYNVTAKDWFFSRCKEVSFRKSTWSLSPLNCKRFPLKLGFRYVRVPFKSGFIALRITITKYLPPFIKEYYGANSRCQVVKHYTNTKWNFWSLG